jgi:predicted acyl esterase
MVTCAAAATCGWTSRSHAQPSQTAMVPMRDSVKLATDVYLPKTGAGPWPVVLHRTPYGKDSFASIADALLKVGVAAVGQDMRGRFASEGTDCVFRCDGDGALKDGYDTLAWLKVQTWSKGPVVTIGGSATGIVQYMLAPTNPPGLAALWAEVATPSLYDHIFFQGGAFHQNQVEGWLAGQKSELFLKDIAAHPLYDSFWEPVQTVGLAPNVRVPAMHVGGWYDIFTQGTIDAFTAYQTKGGSGAAGKQKMILGPWTHGGRGKVKQGQLSYPTSAADVPQAGDLLLKWLGHHLGVTPNQAAIDAIPTVQYYVMGDVDDAGAPGNQWRNATAWPPPAAPIRLYLQPSKTLSESCPPSGAAPSTYAYDPAHPSPTIGGANLLLPAGPMDQKLVESRADVLVFSTELLASPVEITGRIGAHVWVSIDTPDTDLMVRVTDVYPDGRSMLVLDGALRLATRGANDSLKVLSAGEVIEAVVDLWSTSIVINKGHRLRISVTSSNHARFWANPNDGTSYGGTAKPVVSHVTVYHSLERPSYIEVPNPQRKGSEVTLCGVQPQDGGPDGSAGVGGAAGEAGGPEVGTGGSGPGGSGAAGAAGSASGSGGAPAGPSGDAPAAGDEGGCGCRSVGSTGVGAAWLVALGLVAGCVLVRRGSRERRKERESP